MGTSTGVAIEGFWDIYMGTSCSEHDWEGCFLGAFCGRLVEVTGRLLRTMRDVMPPCVPIVQSIGSRSDPVWARYHTTPQVTSSTVTYPSHFARFRCVPFRADT